MLSADGIKELQKELLALTNIFQTLPNLSFMSSWVDEISPTSSIIC